MSPKHSASKHIQKFQNIKFICDNKASSQTSSKPHPLAYNEKALDINVCEYVPKIYECN